MSRLYTNAGEPVHVKQCKGKASAALPSTAVPGATEMMYTSIKLDGQVTTLHHDYDNNQSWMWSSNGKPYWNQQVHEALHELGISVRLEAEYIGATDGSLGSRTKTTAITTYQADFRKGNISEGRAGEKFMVFDILMFDGTDVRGETFTDRLNMLKGLFNFANPAEHKILLPVKQTALAWNAVKSLLPVVVKAGAEGLIAKRAAHVIRVKGGRSNLCIKLKPKPTFYATVVGTEEGKLARAGTIGALVVLDDKGTQATIGGLNSAEWTADPTVFIGLRVKVEYESIIKGSYIQAQYKGAFIGGAEEVTRDMLAIEERAFDEL